MRIAIIILAFLLASLSVLALNQFNFCSRTDIVIFELLSDRPVAHRGYHKLHPENSMSAFQAAIDLGYSIELDVRLSNDNVPVVFHDSTLERMTGQKSAVSDYDYLSLSELKLDNSNEAIPSLSDVLKLINGQTMVIIEIKNEVLPGVLEDSVIDELKTYEGAFALQSFNPFSVSYVSKRLPSSTVGLVLGDLGVATYPALLNLRDNLFTLISEPDFINYHFNTMLSYGTCKQVGTDTLKLGWTLYDSELDYSEKDAKLGVFSIVDNVIVDP